MDATVTFARPELLQVADAVARDKGIDRDEVLEAKIELATSVDGRKRFRGRLLGTVEGTVRLLTDAGEIGLPLDAVARAKLVLTDDLIATAQRRIAQPDPTQTAR